jgi:hypothetical protein
MFFCTGRARYDGPGEGEIAAGIHHLVIPISSGAPRTCTGAMPEEAKAGHFGLALAIEHRSAALEKPVPLAAILADEARSKARSGILQTIALLAEFFPPLDAYISAGAKAPVKIAADELPALLFDTLPVIRLLGIRALLPKALDHLLRPRLSMQIKDTATDTAGFFRADDVLAFDWKVAVGNHLITRAEFERLVKDAAGVVRFKHSRFGGSRHGPVASWYQRHPTPLPAAGLCLALSQRANRLGSVIADDMGLGKTLQVIATLQKLKEDGALDEAKAPGHRAYQFVDQLAEGNWAFRPQSGGWHLPRQQA